MSKKILALVMLTVFLMGSLAACVPAESRNFVPSGDFVLVAGNSASTYLGNDCSEGLLKAFKDAYHVCIQPIYKSGVEINNLQTAVLSGNNYYSANAFLAEDGVWLSEKLTSQAKIAEAEVVLGIDSQKATEIGWEPGSFHTIEEVMSFMNNGTLQTVVCNANQCNSGAMFFTGVVSSIRGDTGNPVTLEDFQNPDIINTSKTFYENVSRSGLSEQEAAQIYLQDKINNENLYSALVTYEPVGAETNAALLAAGKNPLAFFYLYDANVVTSPTLGFVDNGNEEMKTIYTEFVDFLKSANSQAVIAGTGWSPVIYGLTASESVLKPEWGFLTNPQVEYIPIPKRSVMLEAIRTFALYYKKPADIVMCLDNSGSMQNNGGADGLRDALTKITDPSWLAGNQLYPSEYDSVSIYLFGTKVYQPFQMTGNDSSNMMKFRDSVINNMQNMGSTALYDCAAIALEAAITNQNPDHNTVVVLMTDGQRTAGWYRDQFVDYYRQTGTAIPIISIAFGEDASHELGYDNFGRYVNGLYYDGQDLSGAFASIWGGN